MRARVIVVVLGGLVVHGMLRWPLESARTKEWRAAHVLGPELNLDLREKLGQNAFVATLGGARSVVASIEHLRAYAAWEDRDWALVEQRFRLVQQLQPRVPDYWITGAWHMAYNASGYYRYDWKGPRGENNPAALERLRMDYWRQYIVKGQEMFADGMRNNPESWVLAENAALLHRDVYKIVDHVKAAEYYTRAAAIEGAPLRLQRFLGYELSFLPDRRREALDLLTRLYQESAVNHVPTLLATLLDLQFEFGVPQAEQVPLERFGASRREIYESLRDNLLYRRSRGGEYSPAFFAILQEFEKELDIPLPERVPGAGEKF
ncbi:MAG: hypothetical protein ACKO2G_06040 [Verrucomicrobiales bacterium]